MGAMRNGKHRYSYRDATGKEHTKLFDRKVDGERWKREGLAMRDRGEVPLASDAGKRTLREYYEQDFRDRKQWEDSTTRTVNMIMRRCPFADVPLRAITTARVERWVADMVKGTGQHVRPLTPDTIRTRVAYIGGVFAGAVRDGEVTKNPVTGVSLPKRVARSLSTRVPVAVELANMLEVSEPWYANMILIACGTGMRAGELGALQVGDIDFDKRLIYVARQLQHVPARPAEGVAATVATKRPKHGSERVVPVDAQTMNVILTHLVEVGTFGADRWLFPTNRPGGYNTLGYHWRRAREAANVDPAMRLHDTRHWYTSAMVASGGDLLRLSRNLGHGSATFTLSQYGHLFPATDDKLQAAMAGHLSAIRADGADRLRTEGAVGASTSS